MPPALRVDALWKCHAVGVRGCSARIWVLRSISLIVEEGEHVAIVGGAGSGKTTLADCILGLRTPDAGRIELGGRLDVIDERVRRVGGQAVLAFARHPGVVRAWADRVLVLDDGRLGPMRQPSARRVAERELGVLTRTTVR